MRFEEIERCEIGVVLQKEKNERVALLTGRFPAPIKTISVQYLDGDRERVEGCQPEGFQRATLRKGMLLLECRTGHVAVLTGDSGGPLAQIRYLGTETTVRVPLCELVGKRWLAAFGLVPPSRWLVHKTSGEQAVRLETYADSTGELEMVVLLWRTREIKRMKAKDFVPGKPPSPPAGTVSRTTPQ